MRAEILEEIRPWALIQVAGYLAECRAIGHSDPVEAQAFVQSAKKWLGYDGGQQLASLDVTEQEVAVILAHHWSAVGRLANVVMSGMPRYEDEILAAITAG